METSTNPLDPRPKDRDAFRDAEIAFSDAKYSSKTESLREEGQDDQASEEYLPRKSGRRASRVVREEQAQKDTLLGSQKTLPNMIGGGARNTKPQNGNVVKKGSSHSNPLK